jgi:xylan 1,4-beta-xylosidase
MIPGIKRSASYSRRTFCNLGISAAFSKLLNPLHMNALSGLEVGSREVTYQNPIIPGDHPDAGAIRVGNDYYLTHSTYRYTPGLLIWHSQDLVHWTPVTAALKQYMGDVWAPYLCEYQKIFYIYFPVDGHIYVIHAPSPLGPWTDPIALHLSGIDPAHIATPKGQRYLYMAGGKIIELASDGLSTVGKVRKIFDAWPIPEDWQVECTCLEASKVFFKDDYYYLTVAEGGTSGPPTSHMVISARSRSVDGPWEYSPYNPVVHTYNKAERWWSKGHGRLIEAVDGSWWMTLHAYENGFRTLGRQTLLLPIEWTPDNWYCIPKGISASGHILKPPGAAVQRGPQLTDDFTSTQLGLQWQFWGGYDSTRVQTGNGCLMLNANGTSAANTSAMTCITGDHSYTVDVDVEIESNCEAGLLLFYNPEHSVGLRIGSGGIGFRSAGDLKVPATRATFRIVNDEQEIDFYYKLPGKSWIHIRASVDVTCYNQNAFGGFLDLRPSLYACGSGHATFRSFRYTSRPVHPD